MNLYELDNYLNSFLHKEEFGGDPSLNGIQIQREDPYKKINKIAFAVDACEATAKKAAELGADVLFVHHGIFWNGNVNKIVDSHYKRVSTFIKNDLALIAYHLPLDANSEVGNNAGIAKKIGLTNTQLFGTWHGMFIGLKGELPAPLSLEELSKNLMRDGKSPNSMLCFGKKEIRTVGIVSGGGSHDVSQAVSENLDAYITGEFDHADYHFAEEMGINVIGGGHYETETFGVNLVQKKIENELAKKEGIETVFIDLPTGL